MVKESKHEKARVITLFMSFSLFFFNGNGGKAETLPSIATIVVRI